MPIDSRLHVHKLFFHLKRSSFDSPHYSFFKLANICPKQLPRNFQNLSHSGMNTLQDRSSYSTILPSADSHAIEYTDEYEKLQLQQSSDIHDEEQFRVIKLPKICSRWCNLVREVSSWLSMSLLILAKDDSWSAFLWA